MIEKQAADAKAKLLETLEPGMELDGVDTEQLIRSAGLGRVSAKSAGVRQSTPAPAVARKTRSNQAVGAAKPDFIGADSLSRQRRDQKTQASRKKVLPRRAKIS
ncbi:MAG: hypothetical protein EBU92_10950 [Betaproteobacteria bacterium]|nr:hypothetical protein [Betaproteobacteria bacterium]